MISVAFAQTAPAAPASATSSLIQLLPIIVMFVALYFLMLRPQMKRQKEQKKMIDALQTGDEVMTAGGILGKVTKVNEQYVTLNVSNSATTTVEMLFQKGAVQTLLPKGTIKGL